MTKQKVDKKGNSSDSVDHSIDADYQALFTEEFPKAEPGKR